MADWKPVAVYLLDAAKAAFDVLWPGAAGAAIAQFWEKGISLKTRLSQWAIGLTIAAVIVPAFGHVFHWAAPVVNAVGFVLGTLGFKAYPVLRDAAIAGAAGGLKSIPEVFRSWARRPGATPEPPTSTEGEG